MHGDKELIMEQSLNNNTAKQVFFDYQNGLTVSQIADMYNLNRQFVLDVCSRTIHRRQSREILDELQLVEAQHEWWGML